MRSESGFVESIPLNSEENIKLWQDVVGGLIQLRWTLKDRHVRRSPLPEAEHALKNLLNEGVQQSTPRAMIEAFESQLLIDSPQSILDLTGWDYPANLLQKPNFDSFDRTLKIGIVGYIGAGKETVGKILNSEFNSVHFAYSPGLRQLAHALGIPHPFSRDDLRVFINDVYKPAYGSHIFAEWAYHKAKRFAVTNGTKMVSFDGYRTADETKWFLKHQNTELVAVNASPETRFKSGQLRLRTGEDTTYEQFVEDDRVETKWIKPILGLATIVFDNEGTKRENLDVDMECLANQVISHFKKRI